MTDQDKLRIRQLDDKSDYSLWRVRVMSAISIEKATPEMSSIAAGANSSTNEDMQQQASNIIVATLSNQALRIVTTVIGKPIEMMEKLNKR